MKEIKIAMMTCFPVFLFSCLLLMGCPNDDNNDKKKADTLGKIIILQAYGSSSSAAGASHSFVELYNTTDKDIKLNGISLYYADGTTVGSGEINDATEDGAWQMISLDGKTIPAKGSFLILGPKESTAARYQIPDNYGDINSDTFKLSNRSFKVALLQRTKELTVQNPFDTDGNGEKIAGYIDMVGAANAYQGRDLIYGFEKAPARNSASEAVRRQDLEDYDDNSTDFIAARYASDKDGMTNEEVEARKPRNATAGTWDPFAAPKTPDATDNTLLILQVGASTDGAISHSFVELYNAGTGPVNLSTYSLQFANGTDTNVSKTTVDDWTVINLTGNIAAGGSYFILGVLGKATNGSANTSARVDLSTYSPDQTESSLDISNRSYKIALVSNQTKLAAANPFDTDGQGTKSVGYVDMIGAINESPRDGIDAHEGTLLVGITKNVTARRKNLSDTNVNSFDFETLDYRSGSQAGRLSDKELEARRPRNSTAGAWDPFAEVEN
jgi:hypothetical protein